MSVLLFQAREDAYAAKQDHSDLAARQEDNRGQRLREEGEAGPAPRDRVALATGKGRARQPEAPAEAKTADIQADI